MARIFVVTLHYFLLSMLNSAEKVSYRGYHVYVVHVKYEAHINDLLKFQKQNPGIHILSRTPNKDYGLFSIAVSPQSNDVFKMILKRNNLDFSINTPDLESLLESEKVYTKRPKRSDILASDKINFEEYHRHSTINNYLMFLSKKYFKIASVINVTKTTEGRDLLGIHISSNKKTKPIILIEAGIHGREWIAPAFSLYIIHQLIENVENRKLIENVDWIIIPSLNPDGYEYTHTTNRLWRKTRSKGVRCIGVDGNRNFDFHWGEGVLPDDECNDVYGGPRAFSEPEVRAFADLILKYANEIKLSISLHSFGQLILYPWCYNTTPPLNVEELKGLGDRVAEKLNNVTSSEYIVGSVSRALYYSAGSSIDWIMGVPGINLSYAIELPPPMHDHNMMFVVPARFIKHIVMKTFEGIKVFHDYVEHLYV